MKIVKQLVLLAVIVISLFVIFSTLSIFGHRSYADVSGSMTPAIDTGSLVIDRPSTSYKKGDIITFNAPGNSYTVTHRIVKVEKNPAGEVFYQVKGDANSAPDPNLVSQSSVTGKVEFVVPYVGYFISFLKTLPGLIIFILIPATLLIYNEINSIGKEIRKIFPRSKGLPAKVDVDTPKVKPVYGQTPGGAKSSKIIVSVAVLLVLCIAGSLGSTNSLYSADQSLSGVTFDTGTWDTP